MQSFFAYPHSKRIQKSNQIFPVARPTKNIPICGAHLSVPLNIHLNVYGLNKKKRGRKNICPNGELLFFFVICCCFLHETHVDYQRGGRSAGRGRSLTFYCMLETKLTRIWRLAREGEVPSTCISKKGKMRTEQVVKLPLLTEN